MASGVTGRKATRVLVAAILLGGLASLSLVDAAAGPVWRTWTQGVALSRQVRRPVLVYFHDPACRYCRRMDAETFSDPSVQKVLSQCFIAVRVEILDPGGPQLVQQHRVLTFPTVVVLDFRDLRRELMRVPGYVGPGDFLDLVGYVAGGWYARITFDSYMDRLLSKKLPGGGGERGCAEKRA